jgi:hypothetical protein
MLTLIVPFATCKVWVKKQLFSLVANISFTLIAYKEKCNRNGFIDEIYRIIDYSDGFMPPENLNGAAIFEISFHCRLCIPIENSIIIG